MKVIMTGGGTGGHIYPAIAIADEIRRRDKDAEILFVGAEIGMETTIVPENGYDIELITTDGFNRRNLLKNIDVLKKLKKGSSQSKKILKDFKPDIVVGTGGYASAPVVKMAQRLKIPTFIQEQNVIPGVTNKLLEKKVTNVFLGFKEGSEHFRHPDKHIVSGNPVRADFLNINRDEARQSLGINEDDFVLLSFGGSQGAGKINKAMMDVIETFNGVENFKIFMATGGYYYDAIHEELRDRGIELCSNVTLIEYIHDMARYLMASDLVVSRSGALSIAEVTMCGKPAIFIPSPLVTGNHQFFNAMSVAQRGGAVVIEEKDLHEKTLTEEILKLKNNPEVLNDMAGKSAECAPVRAAGIICDRILYSLIK